MSKLYAINSALYLIWHIRNPSEWSLANDTSKGTEKAVEEIRSFAKTVCNALLKIHKARFSGPPSSQDILRVDLGVMPDPTNGGKPTLFVNEITFAPFFVLWQSGTLDTAQVDFLGAAVCKSIEARLKSHTEAYSYPRM